MSLPTEIIQHIFSYTNVKTVIAGQRCNKHFNILLKCLLNKLMKSPGLVFQLADTVYDDKYVKKIAQDKDLSGFTLLYHIKIESCDILDILFGYVKDSYIIYVFKDDFMGNMNFYREIIVQSLNGLGVCLKTLIRDFNPITPTKHMHRIIANLPHNQYKYCTIIKHSSQEPKTRVLISTETNPSTDNIKLFNQNLYIDYIPALSYGLDAGFNNKVVFDPDTFADELEEIEEWHQDNNLEMFTGLHDDAFIISYNCAKFGPKAYTCCGEYYILHPY